MRRAYDGRGPTPAVASQCRTDHGPPRPLRTVRTPIPRQSREDSRPRSIRWNPRKAEGFQGPAHPENLWQPDEVSERPAQAAICLPVSDWEGTTDNADPHPSDTGCKRRGDI